jgi:OOP family OmpA-OmpF porin
MRAGWLVAMALAAPTVGNAAGFFDNPPGFDNRWYITPFGSYTWNDSNLRTTNFFTPQALVGVAPSDNSYDGAGAGLAMGKIINRWLNLELRASYEWLGGDETLFPGKVNNIPFGLNALIFLKREGFQPFIIVGGGGANLRADGGLVAIPNPVTGAPFTNVSSRNSTGWMANAGVGALYPVTDNVSLRVDGGYRWQENVVNQQTFVGRNNGNLGFWVVNAGVQIALGPKPQPPAPPPVVAPPPPPPPPPAPPPAKLLPKKFDFSADVLFDFDKYALKPKGIELLDELAATLQGATFDSIIAIGHTDPIGSKAYNQKLSERRADTVKQYLTSKGIASERISASGKGMSELKVTMADCKASKGRKALIECLQPNRRVDINVSGTKPQ